MTADNEYEDISARLEASERLAETVDQQNKGVIMTALDKAGIAVVVVIFDGSGDDGQIEEIEVQGAVDALPHDNLELGAVEFSAGTIAHSAMPLEDGIVALVYRLLERTHGGWGDNDGAYGEVTFDVVAGTIVLDFNARFTDAENFTHTF
jgi:hypothetical protein